LLKSAARINLRDGQWEGKMRSISPQLPKELVKRLRNKSVQQSDPILVPTYRNLIEITARLAYENKDYQLYFRGQDRDYRNKALSSTIYPSIYRGEVVTQNQIEMRFNILDGLSKRLCEAFKENHIIGYGDVLKRRYVQWSILQHYEVCSTPFIDLTQSLRVAASFAFLASEAENPILLVFALPYPTNRITINSEFDLILIRLLSICPPEALRPYYQDGYLAGTDEIRNEYQSKIELDFNRVLIAKFELKRKHFWGSGFSALPANTLYPEKDRVHAICTELKQEEIGNTIQPGRLGQFIQEWTDLENNIMTLARKQNKKVYSLREALPLILANGGINRNQAREINELRQIRNFVIHKPNEIETEKILSSIKRIRQINNSLFSK
jgi:hypothetical protein